MSIFQALNQGYVLMREGGTKLLPGVGRRSDCASAILLPSQQMAEEFILQIQEDCKDIFGELKAEKVDNLFALMRRASQEGIGAFDSTSSGYLVNPLVFSNRPTEIGDLMPTLLTDWTCEDNLNVLSRTGEKVVSAVDIVPWQRFDISDPLLSIWSTNGEPFRNWDLGKPMLAMLIDDCIPIPRKCSLTEHWASLEGTLPVFTSETDFEFAVSRGLLNSEISLFGPFCAGGYQVLGRNHEHIQQTAYLQVEANPTVAKTLDHGSRQNEISNICLFKIASLPDFIANVCSQLPVLQFGQYSINPYCHRENSGYGWSSSLIPKEILEEQNIVQTADSKIKKRCGSKGTFFTVGGTWSIEAGNQINLQAKSDRWADNATLNWSGGPSISLLSQSTSIAHKDNWKEFTKDEKKEEILRIFKDNLSCDIFDEDEFEGLPAQAHLFAAQLWDTISGEKFLARFDSPYQFLAFLHQGLPADEHARIYGAKSCGSPATAAAGSSNIVLEQLRTRRIDNALKSIAEDAAITGYSPDKILRTCWVVNQLFETLHLDYAGYTQDLLSQCESSDDLAVLCESLNIDRDEALQFKDTVSLIPPSEGFQILQGIINPNDLQKINQKSSYFAANGLLDLAHKGNSLNIDYSTASIQFVKSLEVQLGDLFRIWLRSVSPEAISLDSTRSSRDINAYFETNKMFTIGTMAYLLREVNESLRVSPQQDSPAVISLSLATTAADIQSMMPLLSKDFYKKFLNKVIHAYRNGGAHDQKIELSTCLECRDSILGTSGGVGWLSRVAIATNDLSQYLEIIGSKS
jgi:hypothetical protein